MLVAVVDGQQLDLKFYCCASGDLRRDASSSICLYTHLVSHWNEIIASARNIGRTVSGELVMRTL